MCVIIHYIAICWVSHSELNALIRGLDQAKREHESSDQFRGFILRRKRRAEGPPSTLLPPESAPTWAVAGTSSSSGKCCNVNIC